MGQAMPGASLHARGAGSSVFADAIETAAEAHYVAGGLRGPGGAPGRPAWDRLPPAARAALVADMRTACEAAVYRLALDGLVVLPAAEARRWAGLPSPEPARSVALVVSEPRAARRLQQALPPNWTVLTPGAAATGRIFDLVVLTAPIAPDSAEAGWAQAELLARLRMPDGEVVGAAPPAPMAAE